MVLVSTCLRPTIGGGAERPVKTHLLEVFPYVVDCVHRAISSALLDYNSDLVKEA